MDEAKIRSIVENGTDSEQTSTGMLKDCKHQISPCECEYGLMREAAEQAIALLDSEKLKVKKLEDKLAWLQLHLHCPCSIPCSVGDKNMCDVCKHLGRS